MYITKIYEYEKDGIIKTGENLPENSKLLNVMYILNAEPGFHLIRKAEKEEDKQDVGINIWLKGKDNQNNYEEIEEK